MWFAYKYCRKNNVLHGKREKYLQHSNCDENLNLSNTKVECLILKVYFESSVRTLAKSPRLNRIIKIFFEKNVLWPKYCPIRFRCLFSILCVQRWYVKRSEQHWPTPHDQKYQVIPFLDIWIKYPFDLNYFRKSKKGYLSHR